jgi:hypothetical protein
MVVGRACYANLGLDALGAFLIARVANGDVRARSAPNAVAMPAPMPFDAPVTRTTLPASALVRR